ncbi:dienelactone hydrolase family protein [Streptomyces sp. NPDC012486]|uniref:dienelactone hydrolase family protein n=1 Tax=Streptomyces TaxID=1883 RepID=UPI00068C69BC|nr:MULTISPECIES: dienelactone hydrolase family protein [Streptomyces]MEE1776712.1 dienelactone hydrolase family protein [Streptomyces sp. JV181]
MNLGITRRVLPAFHERLRDELTFPLSWGRSATRDFPAWRAEARAAVGESLLQPLTPGPEPFGPVTLDERPAGTYTARTVEFALSRYGRTRGSLLMPRGSGPFPAVLVLHDHGGEFGIGREKVVRPRSDPERLAPAEAWADRYYDGRFIGDELAARGYAVLAVDTLGWGDRGPLVHEDQQALAANLLQLGTSLAGLAAHEDIRAAAFLASLPEVDERRVGALGFSMGAYRAWQLSALSDGVRAAAAVCWMTGLKELTAPGGNALRGQSAYFMLHPGLHRRLDIPDVASLAAPKPALFHAGGRDHLFTAAGVESAYAALRAVWESQGAGDRLTTRVWPDTGHTFTSAMQAEVYAWLDVRLAGRGAADMTRGRGHHGVRAPAPLPPSRS